MRAYPKVSAMIASAARSSYQPIMTRRLATRAPTPLRPSRITKPTIALTPLQSRRKYSNIIQTQEDALAKLPGLNPSACTYTHSLTPKVLTPPEELVFGRAFTGTLSHTSLLP